MKTLWMVLLLGCGSSSSAKDEPAKVEGDAAYKADIEALCDVIARSGSTDLEPNDRMFKIATWLSSNLKTQEARKFLSTIRPIKGLEKADALDAEANKVGLGRCALATEWRTYPGTSKAQ